MPAHLQPTVLVAYATKYGATAEIAQRIGQQLRACVQSVAVLPIADIHDLNPYDAVVLGSAVYIGQWRKEAAQFLTTQEALLAQRRVWLFSSGPTGLGDPVELMKGWRFPASLQPVADRLQPRNIAFFHGKLDSQQLTMIDRLMVKGVGAPMGDYRDWKAIDAWAASIASELLSSPPGEFGDLDLFRS
jgi:menaquinone-dependent protoporphyrinogen oxidase